MDQHKVVSLSRTYVPNEYTVWLSTRDREQFAGYEDDLREELSAYLLEHARRERLALISRPQIEFHTDERLSLGEFGIQARLVRAEDERDEARQGDHGQTMVYSTAGRVQEQLHEARSARAGRPVVVAEGKRMPVGPGGAVIGRSRDCDIVLADSNVSRRHAEIRPAGGDGWTITDLGSTNGVKVNGRTVSSAPLNPGDEVMVGTVDVRFEVEQ